MAEDISNQVIKILTERKLIKVSDKLAAAQKKLAEGASLYEALVEGKLIDGETLAQTQAELASIPYVNLMEYQIPSEILSIIPESTARGHLIVAYSQDENGLNLAMADPADRQIVEFIRKKVDVPVHVALSSVESVREALGQYQQSLEVELGDVVSVELKNVKVNEESGNLAEAAEDLPIIKITQAILKHAITEGASDIHIEPTEKQVIVRYRIDGILRDVMTLPKAVIAGIVARIKVLSNLKIDEHRLPQDGRFKIEGDGYKVAFRVSTLPVFDGEKVVMRLLDESGNTLGLDDIGIRSGPLQILRRNIHKPHGMILVTGPTGSGKTTTLYAVMKEINTPDVNISTIEDPVEYRMTRINQTQVHPKIGMTFANGLRALVRQDPDVIMVGEIRDEETASLAVNAALTGHLVLSTLHTNSAAGALPRLRDMQVEAFLLASTLNLVMAQRLVRRLCPKCRKKEAVTKAIVEDLAKEFNTDDMLVALKKEKVVPAKAEWTAVEFYQAVGCKVCNDGYKGRMGIYELLEVSPEMQKVITPSTTSTELDTAARAEQGMLSMVEDGILKVVEGVTTLEEVMRVARE